MSTRFFALFVVSVFSSVLFAQDSVQNFVSDSMPEGFEEGKNCIAYTVRETVMFVYEREVVGVNCNVSVEFDGDGKGFRFTSTIPIDGFRTDNATRDRKVREILREGRGDNLFMMAEWLPLKEWKQMIQQPVLHHTGYLVNGDNVISLPHITFQNQSGDTKNISGFADFTFSDFNLVPPKVLGGFWVRAHDTIRLDFRFYHNKIKGMDKL